MTVVRVYLASGQHFDTCAENVKCKYNGLTGELTSFNYADAVRGIPIYLNINKVEAVVQLNVNGGDDDERDEV